LVLTNRRGRGACAGPNSVDDCVTRRHQGRLTANSHVRKGHALAKVLDVQYGLDIENRRERNAATLPFLHEVVDALIREEGGHERVRQRTPQARPTR
jgi:hypothetical protein